LGAQLVDAVDDADHELEDQGDALEQSDGMLMIQDPPEDGEVREHPWRVRAGNEKKFIAACVLAAKNQFGTPALIEANRLVVRKFVADLMTQRGMRPSHISKFLPFVEELVFVPTAHELGAKRMARALAILDRQERYRLELQTESRISRVLRFLLMGSVAGAVREARRA